MIRPLSHWIIRRQWRPVLRGWYWCVYRTKSSRQPFLIYHDLAALMDHIHSPVKMKYYSSTKRGRV